MKKSYKIFALALLSFLIVGSALKIENCICQWVQMSNGMGNLGVCVLKQIGNNIYAGTFNNGVYLSTNNGINWTQTSLNNRTIFSLAVKDNIIFAGSYNNLTPYGVYMSTNNGINWTQTSLNYQSVSSLAVSGNNVIAGSYNYSNPSGIYLSTDNGTTWTQTSLNNRTAYALAVNGNSVFAGTLSNSGVYSSTDNGTNWSQTSLNNRAVGSLAVNGNYIFAGTGNFGVYASSNNGTDWIQTSLNDQSVYALAINGNYVFAGSSTTGVYVSSNNGTDWTQRTEGIGNLYVRSLCVFNNYIFAGTDFNGVYRRPLSELLTGIQTISEMVPVNYSLLQNYPNPFNPTTNVQFSIINVQLVTLKVFDILGRDVATLVNEQLQPGKYEVTFDGSNYSSGIYFYKLSTTEFTDTKRMLMIK